MKKIVIAIVLFCTLYSAYSLDYRQVIFGNNYQNIIEIDADAFFEQYPAVKGTEFGETSYARVYKQIIGESTFYRVLFTYERPVGTYSYESKKLTAADFLNWREIGFSQYVFFKKSDTDLLQLGDSYVFGWNIPASETDEYNGLEIIERNNQIIGIMKYAVRDGYWQQGLGDPFIEYTESFASYCLWTDIIKYEETTVPTISYVNWQDSPSIPEIQIRSRNIPETRGESNTLLDSKRPFMYSIQNAFDGNPATSYVENTTDSMFYLAISFDDIKECTSYNIINGYASNDYYYQNNQISKVAVDKNNFQLKETLEPQVLSFEAIKSKFFFMTVEEINKGTKYSDTCLAEFDMYIEGLGWLFGGNK